MNVSRVWARERGVILKWLLEPDLNLHEMLSFILSIY